MKYSEELHERLVDFQNSVSPFPWSIVISQNPSGHYFSRVVDANMVTVIGTHVTGYLEQELPDINIESLIEYLSSVSCLLEEIKRLREDNNRVRELESRLEQHEYAADWLERWYPEIYEEWLEEYRK